MGRKLGWAIGWGCALSLLAGTVASAEPPWVRQAKAAGFPAQNCRYCHTTALPKKDTFRPDELNDRGRWLLTQKERHATKAVDLRWLERYPGGSEQR